MGCVAAAVALTAVLIGGYYYVEPSLPDASELRDVRLQIPLRIYTRDGRLMAQFGEQMRTPVPYRQIPQLLINAVLAAEDDRFFEHPGVDVAGILRGAFRYIATGGTERVAGGSTITQQVARTTNLLSRDYSLVRKFKEWILALRIEREFTKQEILELYLNTYFFGKSSYGVVAAARTYFGKPLSELTLSEAAILAGIPKGPSIMNPIASPENAKRRRAYVLRRMRELGEISDAEYQAALNEPIESHWHGLELETEAPYVAEMVRLEMLRRFGPAALTAGLRVTTTVDSRLQTAANSAIHEALDAYDRRHGYRGPIGHVDLPAGTASGNVDEERLRQALADYRPTLGLLTGVVLDADDLNADVYLPARGRQTIGLDAVAWASRYINDDRVGPRPNAVSSVLAPGDIVRFREKADGSLELAQLPDVQGAFVALDPQDGAVVALNGGYDFYLSSYNRATQARRQPGSGFKPFVYSAALENGFTTATIVNDAPLALDDPGLEATWKPENYDHKYMGEIRLREALVHSENAAAVRVIRQAGISSTVQYVRRFGFDETATPANASLVLGAGGVAPISLAAGYAVFANGGRRVTPYFIDRVEDIDGNVVYQARPAFACVEKLRAEDAADTEADCVRPEEENAHTVPASGPVDQTPLIDDVAELYPRLRLAPRVITPQNAYLMTDMMQDVVRRGTGAAAYRELHRDDLAGKTGTTNDLRDAWFTGFNADVVASGWVGFDEERPLGGREQGGVTAIPMWISFMREALEGMPLHELERPTGIVDVRINPRTGLVANGTTADSMFEKFRIDHVPPAEPDTPYSSPGTDAGPASSSDLTRSIFQ
ncbi:MAG TPA: penicillin-binding protein 1A [Gammaproteobacteria bacterium]|nr:penicillin-binding protein 1A [Gammaproteobacteria bacterium]